MLSKYAVFGTPIEIVMDDNVAEAYNRFAVALARADDDIEKYLTCLLSLLADTKRDPGPFSTAIILKKL